MQPKEATNKFECKESTIHVKQCSNFATLFYTSEL